MRALSVVQPMPKIPVKAGKSKEIPASVELSGLTLPPSPPSWEQTSLPIC